MSSHNGVILISITVGLDCVAGITEILAARAQYIQVRNIGMKNIVGNLSDCRAAVDFSMTNMPFIIAPVCVAAAQLVALAFGYVIYKDLSNKLYAMAYFLFIWGMLGMGIAVTVLGQKLSYSDGLCRIAHPSLLFAGGFVWFTHGALVGLAYYANSRLMQDDDTPSS
ncbi:unnamed protein product [Cuscuta epithymum]|uniref:Uncharacterized protein n=1 Tax=Cuscuta epithymum TaxID=186058 RepID=A0AAV0FR22_9ASTE|nr:unnamed protein product [Cuscuta epithymum]